MRPRAIQNVPGLDSNASPFERFQEFARRLVQVPKAEADKEDMKSGHAKPISAQSAKRGPRNGSSSGTPERSREIALKAKRARWKRKGSKA